MLKSNDQRRWAWVMLLSAIVLLGIILRLQGLTENTIGHIEIYVPGIQLPPIEFSDPPPRLTLAKTISGPIAGEPHPPGYYLFMYFWTKLFGTGVLAIRLPSALLGAASVLLIYVTGRLDDDSRLAAILAAGMLAFNGYHILWSQTAKMYTMGCFLGLLSTAVLLYTARGPTRPLLWSLVYVAVVLAGLGTVLFFWPIFLTQMIWTLGTSLRQGKLSNIVRWQTITFILGSPLLSIAAYQSQRASYLTTNFLTNLGDFLQFGFLIDSALFERDPFSSPADSPVAIAIIIFLVIVALLLLTVTVQSKRNERSEIGETVGLPFAAVVASGALSFLGILAFAFFANRKNPDQTIPVLATGAIPLLLILFDFLLSRQWSNVRSRWLSLNSRFPWPQALGSPIVLLAILPISAISIVSIFVPLFAARTVLLFVPFLLLALSRGLTSLLRRDNRWLGLVAILFILHVFSVVHFKRQLLHPTDYQDLAENWIPNIHEDDLIFIQRHWVTTPIFYYLNANTYHFVARDYAEQIRENPDSRVWVLSFEGLPSPKEMEDALAGYESTLQIDSLRIRAELYDQP